MGNTSPQTGGTDNLSITSLRLVALSNLIHNQYTMLSFPNPVHQSGIYMIRGNRKFFAEVGMNRTICIGLMVLPVFLHNTELGFIGSDVTDLTSNLPIATALITHSINAHLHIAPWQISARDDQTEDCLRSRTCQD